MCTPKTYDPRYEAAFQAADELLAALPELELTSALKQAAADQGIPHGEEMRAFVTWAMTERLQR